MIALFITIIAVGVVLSVIHGAREYESYIRKTAGESPFGKILSVIYEDDMLIRNGTFKGEMLDMLSDHMEMWEQILERKEEIEGIPGKYSSHRELWDGVIERWKEEDREGRLS